MSHIEPSQELVEKVVKVNRVAKVVSADGAGSASVPSLLLVTRTAWVGAGLGKAGEVPEAIRKGIEDAKKT